MATHHQEKQKRGFLNFYKSSSIKYIQRPKAEQNAVTNKPILLQKLTSRKLENGEEKKHGGPSVVAVEEGGDERGGRGDVVVVEGRRSVSHVETNLVSVASFLQVKVLVTDMPGFMQVHAFRCARRTFDSLDKFSAKHMAYNMKKEFDKVYGPAWHCIVGSNFGSFVTHSTGCFLYFFMEKLYILVFKTKVQKATD